MEISLMGRGEAHPMRSTTRCRDMVEWYRRSSNGGEDVFPKSLLGCEELA